MRYDYHKAMAKPKTILRPAPCPAYDIESLESWLCDLAKEGLILKECGVRLGFFCFTKTEPQAITYRLEATHNQPFFDNESDHPSQEMLVLYRDLGWKYLARYQNFYIFASTETTPRELNSDPAIHARTLNLVKKRQLGAIIIWPLLYGAIWFLLHRNEFWLFSVALGTVCSIWLALCICHFFFRAISEVRHLTHLRKTLQQAGTLNHAKDWRAKQTNHLLQVSFTAIFTLGAIVSFASVWRADASGTRLHTIAEYNQEPPFATMIDLLVEDGDYTYTPQTPIETANTVEIWQDLIFTQNIKWTEIATIKENDILLVDGFFIVDYHEVAFDWIAGQLAQDYAHKMQKQPLYTGEITEIDAPTADYFAAFEMHFGTCFVIQQGNKVVCATLYDYQDTNTTNIPFTPAECAQQIAQSLLQ